MDFLIYTWLKYTVDFFDKLNAPLRKAVKKGGFLKKRQKKAVGAAFPIYVKVGNVVEQCSIVRVLCCCAALSI